MIFDVPRINTSTRNSITPVNSVVIYNTDNNRYEYYDSTSWKPFGEGGVISFNTRTGIVTLLDSDIAELGDFTVSGTLTINNNIIFGSEALKIMISDVDPNVSGVSANTGSIILKDDGSIWQKLDSNDTDWSRVQTDIFTGEPTGFPVDSIGNIDRTSSSISFNEGNRTFSISPSGSSFIVLLQGRQFRKTSTEQKQISNVEGIHYIYYDLDGVLQEATSFSVSLIEKYALVSIIYWDTTNSKAIIFGDERHGCTMDGHTHIRIHADSGAVYVNGMGIDEFTVDGNGTSETNLTYRVGSGSLRDEDILHSLSTIQTSTGIPILYREGSNWRSITPSAVGGTYARALGSIGTPDQIAFNQFSEGVWSRVSLSGNNYVCYHVMATNDINHPYMIIMGTAQYTNKNNAQTGAINEISTLTGLPFVEVVFVGTILFQCKTSYTNSLKARIISTNGSNYVDWRFRSTLNPSTASVSTHNSLGGIYGGSPYYHSDQPINMSDSVQFVGLNIGGNYSLPSVDGVSGQVISTNGSGSLSFTTITQNHNSLTGLQGGGGGNYYHSDQPINTTNSVQFAGLTVLGDLTISGTTTTVDSITLQIQDKNIELGKVISPSDILADGGGITLLGDTNKTLTWSNSTDSWTSSENIDLASGKVYKINNTTVLSDSQVLGKSLPTGDVVGTSDTQSLSNKTLDGFTLNGDINSTGYASDIDLIDNNSSALSFDSAGKSGILEIDTTDSLEKVKMSGGLNVTGTSTLRDVTASGSISLNGLIFPSTDGTNGQAIITDGEGNLTFGDVASEGGAGLTYQITSAPPVSLKLGMPVYWNGTNYAPANASTNTKIPTAIVKELNVGDYTVQYGGILTLTNTQWNEITGGSGGLSTSSGTNSYYLSDVTDGQITNVSPIFSIPVLNCIKNDATNSTVEIKFGTLASTLLNESYSRERETFTGNGSNLTFTLNLTPYSRNTTMVSIDGVIQQGDSFSISNKDIVFSESPPANSEIEVNYVVQKNLNYANITKHTETTVTSKASFTLPVTPNSESEVMAWVGGSYQDNTNFTLSGNVLTFDTNVDSGVKVQFVIFSSIQFADFPFIKRKSITIDNNLTKTLIDVFGNQASGKYDFHVIANPLIGGTVRLQETDPINVRVETFSTDISSTASTSSKLNIYINGSGNLEFQNLLGSSISLMLERHQ